MSDGPRVSMDIMGQHNHLGPVNWGNPGGSIVQAGWHVLLPTRVTLEPSVQRDLQLV